DERAFETLQSFQLLSPLPGFVRQEACKMKLFGPQPAGGQSCHQRARPWNRLNSKTSVDRRLHDSFTGITDARTPRVRHQGNFLAALKALKDFLAPPGFIELEIAEQGLGNAQKLQQLAGPARVLRGDQVALLQSADGSQGYVLQ